MNGSETLLPFVVADQRRRADEAVLVRLALEARNDKYQGSISIGDVARRIRDQLRSAVVRGQLGPVETTPVC